MDNFNDVPTILKIKVPKEGFCKDATEESVLVPQEPFSEQFLKEKKILVWRIFLKSKEPFVEWKGSMDCKGSLWNHWYLNLCTNDERKSSRLGQHEGEQLMKDFLFLSELSL